jgi:DNA-binding CsgD family transcriptional regulator
MLHISEDFMNYFEQMVSIPCFIYHVQKDYYVTVSESLRNKFNAFDADAGFCVFLERMHPSDRVKILDIYTEDIGMMMQHRKGESPPKLHDLEFRMRDRAEQWQKSIIKIDIAGYDHNGRPEKLFGIFWSTISVPELHDPKLDHIVDDLYGEQLIQCFKNVKEKVLGPSSAKQKKTATATLTVREREIMQLISKGLSTKEIAGKLFISFHTVESHRKNLLAKFNAKNSVELLTLLKA